MSTLSNPRLVSRFEGAARALGAFVIAIGALVLIGWIFNVPALKSVLPNLAAMKSNAAVCFMMLGIALVLLAEERPSRRRLLAARFCAAFVLAVGLVTAGEYLFGWDLPIDELLFRDPVRESSVVAHPGRMVPMVALNFILVGLALLLLSGQGAAGQRWAQALAILAILIGSFTISAYNLQVESLYSFKLYSLMALHGAIAFIALGTGVLLARSQTGLAGVLSAADAGGVVARRLLPAALLIPFLLAWITMYGVRNGTYDDNIAAAVRVTLFMGIFAAIVWSSAHLLSRTDAERRKAEESLRRTADELARSNAELEQFAYVASHDLQEPLRAVAGCVQLIQRRYQEKLDERGDELIRHTMDGAQRMQNLINDLLTYSRVGTRARPFEPVNVAGLMRDVLANLEVAIRESGTQVTHNGLPTVTGDPVQMTQLLQNLIGNAIKFRGAEPPRVHVGARREGAEWRFAISDNGIGIEPQYFERIFSVFQRLHTTREYPGTGIGLAICKKIVERHGGRIWVESGLDRGTTFYFTLPEIILSGETKT